MSWVSSHTKQQSVGGGATPSGYVRPADWLTMPVLTASDQQLSMLIAVADDTTGLNKIAFKVSGDYTVDWGDGSAAENFSTGVKAEHTYAWEDISGTTLTSDGYRQCICTVTPQSGQNLTSFDLKVWPTTHPIMWRQPILSFVGAGANITTLGFSGSLFRTYAPISLLREITIPKLGSITNFSYAWYVCPSLQSLSVDTAAGTDFSYAWSGCSSLQSLSVNTANGTSFLYAWSGCSSLQSLSVNTDKGKNFSNAWNGCSRLQSLSVNTDKGTNFSNAWNGCSSLQSLSVDTSQGTNFYMAWAGCWSLRSLSVTGQPLSFNVSDAKLSTSAIENLFTSLGTVTGQTVTCSGCFGYAGLSTAQREIATNKGWTIA